LEEKFMKKFILINGPMGVGKSTVSRKVCEMLGRAAFIDGDWGLNIFPFVGNAETKTMAIDNILHMVKNYHKCSECDTVILSWIMSGHMINEIILGLYDVDFQIYNIVLTCSKESLMNRWQKDVGNRWRNDINLIASMKSIDSDFTERAEKHFLIETSAISADIVAKKIIEMIEYELFE